MVVAPLWATDQGLRNPGHNLKSESCSHRVVKLLEKWRVVIKRIITPQRENSLNFMDVWLFGILQDGNCSSEQ